MVIFPLGTQTSAFLLEGHMLTASVLSKVGKSPSEALAQRLRAQAETLDWVTQQISVGVAKLGPHSDPCAVAPETPCLLLGPWQWQ